MFLLIDRMGYTTICIFFPSWVSDALAERLDELLADDARRSAFGAQAKRDAEATFLAEQMTRKIEKLYLEARK